jgi:hypothetical protein
MRFKIAATDRSTGATVYGRIGPNAAVAFRTGIAIGASLAHKLGLHTDPAAGLHTDPAAGQSMDLETAGAALESVCDMLARTRGSWISDPRIVAA